MINEYALEPAIVNSWERLQRVLAQFGFEKGRLIARVPSKWRKAVLDALPATVPETERSRMVARLRDFEAHACVAREHHWDPGQLWMANVIRLHEEAQFRLILCASDNAAPLPLYSYSALDEFEPPEGWEVSSRVKRDRAGMAQSLRLVLQTAERLIRFVDPFFHPNKQRFFHPMEQFLEQVRDAKPTGCGPRIEIHVSNESDRTTLERAARERLAPLLPTNSSLQIIRWPAHRMHNRFVITEKVAVILGMGLDENEKGSQGVETDLFVRLNAIEHRHLLAEYDPAGGNPGKPDGDPIVIDGIRR